MTVAKVLQTLVDGHQKLQDGLLKIQEGQVRLEQGQVKLAKDINNLRSEMNQRFEENKAEHYQMRTEMHNLDLKLTSRIDKIGHSVAFLEEDAPTRDEHEKLVKRVEKVEKKVALF